MKQKISLKEINRLAIPAIFAGIVEPIISLTDVAVAGRLLHNADEALGAIGLVGSFLSAMMWIFLQTSNAIAALVSHGVGEGRVKRLKSLVSQLLVLNLVIGVVFSIVTFFTSNYIFKLYGADNHLLETCIRYFDIRVWGFPLTLLTFTIFGIFRGYQNTSWAMLISLVGGFLNVALDILLVFEFDMDVEGIAIASLTAQFIMFIAAFYFLYTKTPFKLIKLFPLHPDFGRTLSMSLDLFIRSVSLNLALFLAFRFATLLGEGDENQFVGAHAILIQIFMFSAFLLDGYALAGAALSGKLFGAKDLKKLTVLVQDLIKIMLMVGCGLAMIYLALYQPIGRILTKSETVLSVFYSAFWIVILMQPLNAVAFLFDGVYKGLGETKVMRNVFVIALILGFLPAIYAFRYFDWGMVGIWLSFLIWILFRIGGLMLHFRKKYYMKG